MAKLIKDEVTLALDGEVSPEAFARAAGDLARLTRALSEEVAPGVALEWTVSGLEQGSTAETALCMPTDPAGMPWVPRVISAHERFANAMQSGGEIPFRSPIVSDVARSLRALPGGRLIRVRFETADAGYTVAGAPTAELAASGVRETALGAVRGRVQTISQRASLRFTVYDLVDGKAVCCYLEEGTIGEETLRAVWGQIVDVEGVIRRDSVTGRALTVRRITGIHVVDSSGGYGAREAIRSLPGILAGTTSEDSIRGGRDDG